MYLCVYFFKKFVLSTNVSVSNTVLFFTKLIGSWGDRWYFKNHTNRWKIASVIRWHGAVGAFSGKVWPCREEVRAGFANEARSKLGEKRREDPLSREKRTCTGQKPDEREVKECHSFKGREKKMRGTVGGGPCRPSTLGGGGLCVNYTGAAGRHFNRARSQANRQMNDLNLIEPVASGSKRERGTGSLSPQGGNQPNLERGAFCRTSDPLWLSNKSRTHIRKGRRKVELI